MPFRNLIIIAIAVLVSLACYTVAAKKRYANLFAEAMEVVDKEALHVVPPEGLFTSAMNGMMKRLDEHSAFIAGERFKAFDEDMRQEFGGVGMYVEINPENKRLFVLSPMPGTPAFAAGLQIGDEIIEIDGENVEGTPREDAVKRLRGPVGSPVRLTLERNGESRSVVIVRAVISVPSVNGDFREPTGKWRFVLEDHPRIGYIRLSQFGEKSAAEIETVLHDLEGQIDGMILDLRNNPGGLLDVAINICDLFLEKDDVIVTTRGREKVLIKSVSATTDPVVNPGLPVVLLINRYSASASEIVAGCLQDHQRAVVIGEQSWGKGTVQNVIPMQRGTSALKLTTASYWRPSGKHIDRNDPIAIKTKTWGVHPDADYQIEMSEEEVFDNLRFRSIRDLEGLVSPENHETFEAIKQMRLKIKRHDSDGAPAKDSVPQLAPSTVPRTGHGSDAPDGDILANDDQDKDALENGAPDNDVLETSPPHNDRPLLRALEFFNRVLSKQQIAA